MEYNKNKFMKTSDKKVLHKVKKQWVVLSMSLLALLGGGAVAHQAMAHADSNQQSQPTDPITVLKNRINANLTKATQNQPTSTTQNRHSKSQSSVTSVGQQAE